MNNKTKILHLKARIEEIKRGELNITFLSENGYIRIGEGDNMFYNDLGKEIIEKSKAFIIDSIANEINKIETGQGNKKKIIEQKEPKQIALMTESEMFEIWEIVFNDFLSSEEKENIVIKLKRMVCDYELNRYFLLYKEKELSIWFDGSVTANINGQLSYFKGCDKRVDAGLEKWFKENNYKLGLD